MYMFYCMSLVIQLQPQIMLLTNNEFVYCSHLLVALWSLCPCNYHYLLINDKCFMFKVIEEANIRTFYTPSSKVPQVLSISFSYGSLHPFNRQVNKPWEGGHVAMCYSRNFSRLQQAIWLNSWICQFSQVDVSKHTMYIRMIVFLKFMGFSKLQTGEAMNILIMLPLFPKSSTIFHIF